MKLGINAVLFGMVCWAAAVAWGKDQTVRIRDREKETVLVRTEDGEKYTGMTRYRVEKTGTGKIFSYEYKDKTSHWQVTTNTQGIPSRISYRSREGQVTFDFDGAGNVTASGTWNGKPVHDKIKLSANVTVENMLVLRSLPLKDGEVYEFDLLQTDELPSLKAYPMSFQLEGRETVTVPAGTFRCLKVRFTFGDWRRFFWKAFYYVTDDHRRMVVKIENIPNGGITELMKVE
jgi:hypothetical protein